MGADTATIIANARKERAATLAWRSPVLRRCPNGSPRRLLAGNMSSDCKTKHVLSSSACERYEALARSATSPRQDDHTLRMEVADNLD